MSLENNEIEERFKRIETTMLTIADALEDLGNYKFWNLIQNMLHPKPVPSLKELDEKLDKIIEPPQQEEEEPPTSTFCGATSICAKCNIVYCVSLGHTCKKIKDYWRCELCDEVFFNEEQVRIHKHKAEKSKAQKKCEDLLEYIKQHPTERFWQALKNTSGFDFIFGVGNDGVHTDTYEIKD